MRYSSHVTPEIHGLPDEVAFGCKHSSSLGSRNIAVSLQGGVHQQKGDSAGQVAKKGEFSKRSDSAKCKP